MEPTNSAAQNPEPYPQPDSPNLICLRPLARAMILPAIDNGTALLANNNLSVPQMLVAGLLHKGTKGVLAASSKVGKTWLLLDLAISVATGIPFLKWVTTKGRVLFINFEIHRTFFRDRLKIIQRAKDIKDVENLDVWNLRGKFTDFDALVAEILKRIQDNGYALIILDPIYKAMVGRAENTAGAVGKLCNNIERLVEKTGAAVVYAHHFTKGNQSKKAAMDRMSGSGVFARDADTIITLTEHLEENCYSVETTLRNLPPQAPFVVQWQFPLMVEQPELDPTELKKSQADVPPSEDHEYLLELLTDKPLTTTEWQRSATTIAKATFYRWLKNLKASGRASQDATGFWTRAAAAPGGRAPALAVPPAAPKAVLATSTGTPADASQARPSKNGDRAETAETDGTNETAGNHETQSHSQS